MLTSGALQYCPDPYVELSKLLNVKTSYFAVLRACMTPDNVDEIRIQKSLLSENGIGPLPSGVENRETFFPITFIQKSKFNEYLLKSGYQTMLTFDDVSGTIDRSQIGFSSLFVRIN